MPVSMRVLSSFCSSARVLVRVSSWTVMMNRFCPMLFSVLVTLRPLSSWFQATFVACLRCVASLSYSLRLIATTTSGCTASSGGSLWLHCWTVESSAGY